MIVPVAPPRCVYCGICSFAVLDDFCVDSRACAYRHDLRQRHLGASVAQGVNVWAVVW